MSRHELAHVILQGTGTILALLVILALRRLRAVERRQDEQTPLPVVDVDEVPIIGFESEISAPVRQQLSENLRAWAHNRTPLTIGGGGRIIGVAKVPIVRAITDPPGVRAAMREIDELLAELEEVES